MTYRKQIILVALGALSCAGAAVAQTAQGGGSAAARGDAAAAVASNPAASAQASANVSAQAAAQMDALRKHIAAGSAKVSAHACADADAKMVTTVNHVNAEAKQSGTSKVAARLAGEFRTSAVALTAERNQLDASWGDLTVAHTIAANSKTDVTAEQLLQLRWEGSSWGHLAAGLGMELGSVVSAVRTEGRVATGLASADGRVSAIHGEGARLGGVGIDTRAGVGVGAGAAGADVRVGAGAGVKIGGKP
jgi:hypothetical protein